VASEAPVNTPPDRHDARLLAGTQCAALAAMVAIFELIHGAWYVRLVPGVLVVVLANFGARLWVRRRHAP
jgi:hypothetical protein